jgi:hypothetical protein
MPPTVKLRPLAASLVERLAASTGWTPEEVVEFAVQNLHTLQVGLVAGRSGGRTSAQVPAEILGLLLFPPVAATSEARPASDPPRAVRALEPRRLEPMPKAIDVDAHPPPASPSVAPSLPADEHEDTSLVLAYAARMTTPFASRGLAQIMARDGEADIDAVRIGRILRDAAWPAQQNAEGSARVWLPRS